jgi:hypothetical protein
MEDGRLEGIVLKDRASPYRDGSRAGWFKVKDPSSYEREAWPLRKPLTLVTGLFGAALVTISCGIAFPDDAGHCAAKVALAARLTVDMSQPAVIWATDANGSRISLRIPGGYGVTSNNTIVDPDRRPFAKTGDLIVSGCQDLVQNAVMISEADVRATINR